MRKYEEKGIDGPSDGRGRTKPESEMTDTKKLRAQVKMLEARLRDKQIEEAHPLFHSDRGFQYTSKIIRQKLDDAKMTQSMSGVGRCIDNGPMEGFWGVLKSEMYYLRKFTDESDLIDAIEKYILFYNTKRYRKRLHCMTPMEFYEAA